MPTYDQPVLAWQDVQDVERCLHGRLVQAGEGASGAVCSGGTIQVSETKRDKSRKHHRLAGLELGRDDGVGLGRGCTDVDTATALGPRRVKSAVADSDGAVGTARDEGGAAEVEDDLCRRTLCQFFKKTLSKTL